MYFELAKNYLELNEYQLAEHALIKANELKPNNEWILNAMYKLYKATQDDEKIIKTLLGLVNLIVHMRMLWCTIILEIKNMMRQYL